MSEKVQKQTTEKGKIRFNSREKKRLAFYACFIALPLLQFCLFYIYTNFNSILLAFQTYIPNANATGYRIEFAGFTNFVKAFQTIVENFFMIKNSFIMFLCSTLLGMTLALLMSFYLYKRFVAAGFFKVILFMPQIVSHVVFAMLFRYIVNDVYPWIVLQTTGENIWGLLVNPETRFPLTVFFNLWVGFGVNVLLFHGAMEGINPSVVESAQLDGVNLAQEFWFITIPLIFPTFVTFLVLGLAGIFTNQMNLYSLYGAYAEELSTFGYFIYLNSSKSDVVASVGYLSYSELSAVGLLLTLVVFPITFFTRKLLEKYGPSTD